MKLTDQDLDLIYDFAHKKYVDDGSKSCYPIPKTWVYAIKRFLEGKGYAIIIKKSSDVTADDDMLQLQQTKD